MVFFSGRTFLRRVSFPSGFPCQSECSMAERAGRASKWVVFGGRRQRFLVGGVALIAIERTSGFCNFTDGRQSSKYKNQSNKLWTRLDSTSLPTTDAGRYKYVSWRNPTCSDGRHLGQRRGISMKLQTFLLVHGNDCCAF